MPLINTAISVLAIVIVAILGFKIFKRLIGVAILAIILLAIVWYMGWLF